MDFNQAKRFYDLEKTVRSIISHLVNEDNYIDGKFNGDGLLELIQEKKATQKWMIEKWSGPENHNGDYNSITIRVNGLQYYDFRRASLSIPEMRELAKQLLECANELEQNQSK